MNRLILLLLALVLAAPAAAEPILLKPARVFDGVNPTPHEGWTVLVDGDRIVDAGPNVAAPAGSKVIDLPGATLLPGLIEGHSHLFLHPYNETLWDDQVLHEPLALRTARAVVSAERTLQAGFTTERDLGTEGAGFADVGLRQAIDQGIVPGPRLLVATKAIVARGAYGPKGFEPGLAIPQGAQEVAGVDEIVRRSATRSPAAPTSSNSTPIITGERANRPASPSARPSSTPVSRRPTMPAGWSRSTPPPPRACAARSSPAPTPSSTAMAVPPRCSS